MKHHCSPHNLSAQLVKLTGNICFTGKPHRLKQMLKNMGEKGTSAYLHKPGTFSGSWRGFSDLEKPEEKTWCLLRHNETILDRKSSGQSPPKPATAAQHCLSTKNTHVTPTQPQMWIKSEEMHNSDLKSVLCLLGTTS